jgi:hypothetical protein
MSNAKSIEFSSDRRLVKAIEISLDKLLCIADGSENKICIFAIFPDGCIAHASFLKVLQGLYPVCPVM